MTEVTAGDGEALRRRIDGLPATARTLLLQASVIGAEAEVSMLGEIAGLEDGDLLDAVDAALRAGLVTEPAPGRIGFPHPLVRDALYGSPSRLRRARLHAQAAAALERHSPGDVSTLARHFAAAGTDPAKAARYCQRGVTPPRAAFADSRLRWQPLQVTGKFTVSPPADPRGMTTTNGLRHGH